MSRVRSAILGLSCLLAAGCVEGELNYTVNPDGSAKVRIDVVAAKPLEFNVGPEKADEPLDALLRRAIKSTLESPGVSAWKDVAAEWRPDGKLKFTGTAYLRRLGDYDGKSGIPMLGPNLAAERGPDGSLRLVAKQSDAKGDQPPRRKPKTPAEIAKMTDEELDRHVLRELIDGQSAKPLLRAMLGDAKVKAVYTLPGEVTAATGFTRDGKTASFTLDGNKILANLEKLFVQDKAAWRKMYREATAPDFLEHLVFGMTDRASITVAKPGEPQFDFDKEVKDARAAYPEVRKKFGFGDDLRLPTADPAPKK